MKSLSKSSKLWSLVAAGLAFQTVAAEACSVCFGRSDSRLATGLNWGIFTLLGIVFVVLSLFAVFAVYLGKRSAMVNGAREAQLAAQQEESASHDTKA